MNITIKDIAKTVGLSITTVSRALNDFDDVNPETKELIKKAAEDMGYTPNTLAQRFQKRRADTIGFIIPTFGPRFSDPFFSEFIAGVGNMAADLGYDLLVSTRPPGDEEMATYRQMVHGHSVDGLVVVRTRREDERISYLMSTNFPFVAFGRIEVDSDFPYVDEDSYYGMGLIGNYLNQMNHKRIAFITPPEELMFAKLRLDGLSESLRGNGIPLDPNLIRHGDLTQRSGYEIAMELLEKPDPPSAIVACNDLMAFGAMSAAQDRGLVVGRDISITGFDDIPMASHSHPPLTTVHQPIYQIGNRVCELLIRKLRSTPNLDEHILLRPELIVRASSGPYKCS